jgi:predicted permease
VRLIIGPALALGLSAIFGLNTVTRQGSIIEAAMPSAVATSVLATEYKLDSSIVTATILLTTLLSPLTLTLLIVYLK